MEASTGKIVLNVGGVRYKTYPSTLQAFPGTKLCSLTEPQASTKFDYNPNTKEFFFDRSGSLFGQVLNYYRTKHLHCPTDVCRSVFEEELAFWEIPGPQLAPCCWRKLSTREGQEEDFDVGDVSEQEAGQGLLGQADRRNGRRWTWWRPRLWDLFEKPYSSRWAMGLAATSLLSTVTIIILLCVESKAFDHFIIQNHTDGDGHYYHHYHHVSSVSSYKVAPYFLHLELFFILWFMFEFFIRLTSCSDIKKFLKNPLNVADFISLFPVFIELFSLGHSHEEGFLVWWLGLFRVVYIVKLLKILKFVETPLMLRALPYTFRAILREILILMIIFALEILFFGALCYYGELLGDNLDMQFHNIDSSFWWSVNTLTTVGYGDILPISVFGRVIGACTALCGVLTIIVPIPIFLIKFKSYYDAALIKEKRKRMRKQAPALPS
ncbi:potassium voltage-gated channel subfamily C member 3-like [Rhineura floridana]|uniref:potassium voltage-gated channel subfamily C member 3-like n=1 Tax=Rhineura floridana TaxID=261503 RepID=UPI002AC84D27|nr:potassium voltage-gated channel subfamily C member 3-like [Rhineura floridana]